MLPAAERATMRDRVTVLGGVTVVDTPLVTRAMDLARKHSEPFLFNHAVRSWLFAVRLGQLAEALIRLVRFIVGIKLHTEDLSVEQGVRMFREDAYLEEATARREAERGTFDPTYLVYSAGKMMLLKLRQDCRAQQGKAFSLRTFHDTLLGNGSAPFWLHRQLMLGADADAVLD